MEKEIFAECGVWKNFDDLEESLSLEELIELYDVTMKRFERQAEVIVMALGGSMGGGMPSSPGQDVVEIDVMAGQGLTGLTM